MRPRRLPRSLDDIRGLRVARWIRESTAGQYDRYGPASQREQQDRFIERHGLLDTGLVFQVAHSGTTVWRSATMTEMLAEARAGAFDLLLAGYSDRWQRNLRRTLELLEDGLHPAGVALVMCDRRILSSDPQDWDELISEAAGATPCRAAAHPRDRPRADANRGWPVRAVRARQRERQGPRRADRVGRDPDPDDPDEPALQRLGPAPSPE
jgi:DNA invertase Pin-like site-specific DNA recombinase